MILSSFYEEKTNDLRIAEEDWLAIYMFAREAIRDENRRQFTTMQTVFTWKIHTRALKSDEFSAFRIGCDL